MRSQDRERHDHLEDRCRHQRAEKDERRQRDDASHVGRASFDRCGGLAAIRQRPRGEADTENDGEHGGACAENNRSFRYNHCSNPSWPVPKTRA
jgi:hypothetical protein